MGIVRRNQYVVYCDSDDCSDGLGLAYDFSDRQSLIRYIGTSGKDGAWLKVGRKWYCPECAERILGGEQ